MCGNIFFLFLVVILTFYIFHTVQSSRVKKSEPFRGGGGMGGGGRGMGKRMLIQNMEEMAIRLYHN
jgi:hypothetical protein